MDWNTYFLNIAKEVAKKSKDDSSQVGCVIVDESNRPVSFGFNGWVRGCDENFMENKRPMKYHLVCHAEMNALIFAKRDLTNCKVYSTHAPCETCLKYMLQAGIKEIYYENNEPTIKRGSVDQRVAIKKLLESVAPSFDFESGTEEIYTCINLKTKDYYLKEIDDSFKEGKNGKEGMAY